MKASAVGRKSINLELRVWYDPGSGHIKLAGEGLTASTVSDDPASKRYHPNLYRKLARALRDAGAPAPDGAVRKRGQYTFSLAATCEGHRLRAPGKCILSPFSVRGKR